MPGVPDPTVVARPANPHGREDAEAMREAAQPLLEFEQVEDKQYDSQRLPEFGQRLVALAEYLTKTCRTPEKYDVRAASGLVYNAQSICSTAVEEAA